ncbi:MAG: hypothetical protein Phog2KO_17650 [Phototrophicaceae bacterium]
MIVMGAHAVGLLGFIAIGVALIILGRLSQRLGKVTHARPYFIGNYVAAVLVWAGAVFRFYFITIAPPNLPAPDDKLVYILLSDGLPALGITLGLIVTWYYWSWLLAERD